MIRIIVPVLDRPQNVKPLLESLATSDPGDRTKVTFIVSPGDTAEQNALNEIGAEYLRAPFPPGRGDWARKINFATQLYTDEAVWFLLGADDLRFHKGWAAAALDCARNTGALVIGTNDLGNKLAHRHKNFSTHPLVHYTYATNGVIDQPGDLLNEQYDHNFPDRELAETAALRGVWAYCDDAIVEHLHPGWGKAESDATYEKGVRRFHEDQRIFMHRRRLWRHKDMNPRLRRRVHSR